MLPVRVTQAAYDELRKALADDGAERWLELETAGLRRALDLSQVVYVALDTDEHRVGF